MPRPLSAAVLDRHYHRRPSHGQKNDSSLLNPLLILLLLCCNLMLMWVVVKIFIALCREKGGGNVSWFHERMMSLVWSVSYVFGRLPFVSDLPWVWVCHADDEPHISSPLNIYPSNVWKRFLCSSPMPGAWILNMGCVILWMCWGNCFIPLVQNQSIADAENCRELYIYWPR